MSNNIMDNKQFVRKPFTIEAVRLTNDNFDEVLSWCSGKSGTDAQGHYIHVPVRNPLNVRQEKAYVGDWVLASKSGFKSYTNGAFQSNFVASQPNTVPLPSSPIDNGVGSRLVDSQPVSVNVFDQPQELRTVDAPVDARDAIAGKQ